MSPATRIAADRLDVTFHSDGVKCAAWFYPAAAVVDDKRPAAVVVMGHGLGGTKDTGLDPYARALQQAGYAVFAFDYRGFGESEGLPRQRVSMRNQVADYHAACAAAARQPGVDPSRLILWGVSQSGGHVFEVGATRSDVAAILAVVPLVNGLAAARHALPLHTPRSLLRSTTTGWRSSARQLAGKSPATIPIVARPGEFGALTAPGYYEAYTELAGPSWRNEVDATIGTEIATHRPGRFAKHITAPMLVQIADLDQGAPPHAAAKAAFAARAEVRHYPCDHFDVFAGVGGTNWFDRCVAHQVAFLDHHLRNPIPTTDQE
ncbi:alpha/beta hydrolase [Gordonia sp. X0973]|uniref:alpha/beta hydrolase n=1 Tax=Gordonia sp. X0973 TaxID=2742602 RepID=UPI000F52B58F|nr:alpha/beta hydrolase [Gordonia sp. X0973]QKT06935.1 alpha/beta hydrolase [Gordonia sp. X0973]